VLSNVSNNLDIIKSHKEEVFEEKINDFLKDMINMGYTKDEVINKIKETKI
jgi:DNA-binding transcriptional regulator YhcF (GntR family)